jgi:hypothetical protein
MRCVVSRWFQFDVKRVKSKPFGADLLKFIFRVAFRARFWNFVKKPGFFVDPEFTNVYMLFDGSNGPSFTKSGDVQEHVYICEFRVDKKARLFDKIPKSSSKSNSKNKFQQVCTKWFAFDTFDIKLKPSRNYTPHEVPEKWKSALQTPRSSSKSYDDCDNTKTKQVSKSKKPSLKIKNREKLDTTLLRLLANLPNASDPVDASHLLEALDDGDGKSRPKRCIKASS